MHAIITWFFSRAWNYSIPQDWEKSVFALMCVCLNVSPPHRRGDKGTQLSSQVFSCSILSARQVFLQPNTLKGILHPSKKLKKIPWMILALKRQPQCLVLKQRQGHILNLVIGFPFWQKWRCWNFFWSWAVSWEENLVESPQEKSEPWTWW